MYKAIIAAVAVGVAVSAGAVTTISSTNGPDLLPANQKIIFDFEGAPPAGLTGTGSLVTGSSKDVYAAPYKDKTQYLETGKNHTSTLTLTDTTKTLSFYWGSIDAFNEVAFFDDGGNLVSGYFGNQIPPAPANGSIGSPLDNRRVTFDFGDARVKYITFNSSKNAFEIDDFAVAVVPEPATWGLMIAGFAMVGASLRRRKTVFAA